MRPPGLWHGPQVNPLHSVSRHKLQHQRVGVQPVGCRERPEGARGLVILRADVAAVGESRARVPAPSAVKGRRQNEDHVAVKGGQMGEIFLGSSEPGSMEAEITSIARVMGLSRNALDPASRAGGLEISQESCDLQWMRMTEASDSWHLFRLSHRSHCHGFRSRKRKIIQPG